MVSPIGCHQRSVGGTTNPETLQLCQAQRMSKPRFLLFAALFWLLFGLVAGFQVWISMMTHGHFIPLLLGYFLATWVVWLAPTALILWLAKRFPVTPPRLASVLMHFSAATLIALLHTLYSLKLMLMLRPYDRMTASASQLEIGNVLLAQLPLGWILYLLVLGCVLALEFYQRYHERTLEAARLEQSLTDSRLHALELQLQPHFLFNTLNAIAGLVRVNRGSEAVTMIAGLADLLRYSLDHAGRQRVRLAEEIEVIKRYLEIQSVRFPDRMSFSVHLDDDIRDAAVPILILQPLAENAVRHGIAASSAAGSITISARRDGERVQLQILSSGTLTQSPVEGIGLRNTRARLHSLYGQDAAFSLSQLEDKVLAQLNLPRQRAA